MPRTEQSAAWSEQKSVPEPRPNFDAAEAPEFSAPELAVLYGPRCAALISDTLEVERGLRSSVPPSFLIHMSFAAPPLEVRAA